MKFAFLLVFAFFPSIMFAYSDVEGNNDDSVMNHQVRKVPRSHHAVIYNGAWNFAFDDYALYPFGLKYVYNKKFGGYVNCRFNLNHKYLLTVGGVKPLSKNYMLYIGTGIAENQYSGPYYSGKMFIGEGGLILSVGYFSLDMGVGLKLSTLNDYHANRFLLNIGIGIDF